MVPLTPDEIYQMSSLARRLILLSGEPEFVARGSYETVRVARACGLTIADTPDGLTIRQDVPPYVLVYSESPAGEPEHNEPLLLRYYLWELQKEYPLDAMAL